MNVLMDILSMVITIVATVVSGVLVFVLQSVIRENARLKKEKDEKQCRRDQALEHGMVCILRKHLMDSYDACMAKGYITATELESGLAMYDAYKGLGGNGMIDHMKEEIETLHIKD